MLSRTNETDAKDIGETMSRLRDSTEEQAKIAAEKIGTYIHENPTTILLGGLILGLIIGTMIPRTVKIKIEDKKKTVF